MSGHSKWATIRRKKEKTDAARGKVFTRLIKEIVIAARMGGGDEVSNPRLRTAISSAKGANMPNKNIDQAIKRGTGELPGVTYEECTYEGYGPGGVAILLECMTDNKRRTVAEIRHIITKFDGSLATAGAVSWMFEKKGIIVVENFESDEDELLEVVLEAGAEDMTVEDATFEITTAPEDLETVRDYLAEKGIPLSSSEVTKVPKDIKKIEGRQAETALKMLERLEDNDDVQNLYTNLDIDE